MTATYSVFKLIHLVGVFTLFIAFGSIIATEKPSRWLSLLHGLALLIIIAAGFAMLHELGIHGAPPFWVNGKLVIWLLFGAALMPAKRKLLPQGVLVSILLLLGAGAGYLALWKPGQ